MTEPKRDEVVGLGEVPHTPVSQADGHAACLCGTKEHPSVDPSCPEHGTIADAVRLTRAYGTHIAVLKGSTT